MAAEEIDILGTEQSPFKTAVQTVGKAGKAVGQGLLGIEEEPDNFQDAAFSAQSVAGSQPKIHGPTSQGQAGAEKPMSRIEFLARGGLGNSISKMLQDVRTNVAHERHKKAYMELNKEGFAGAKKLYNDALSKYPDINMWVPRPEYFLMTDGTFDTQKYHEAFRLGIVKYKDSLAKEAKAKIDADKRRGVRDPEVQAAFDAMQAYAKENPNATSEELRDVYTSKTKLAMPSDVAAYAEGRQDPKELARHEQIGERGRAAHERSKERLRLAHSLRIENQKATEDKAISEPSLISRLQQFAKMRIGLEEDLRNAIEEMGMYERYNQKDNPNKVLYDTALASFKKIKEEIASQIKVATGMISAHKKRFPYIDAYKLEKIKPEEIVNMNVEGGGDGEVPTLDGETRATTQKTQPKKSLDDFMKMQ